MLQCPCCGCFTLEERDAWEICPVCFWEDEHVQSDHEVSGGNGISLHEARLNYARLGACDHNHITHVRKPTPDELPRTV